MSESYSDRSLGRTTPPRGAAVMVAEPSTLFARELIAQLLPGADPDRLVLALLAEREARDQGLASSEVYNSEEQVAARELRRVRSDIALGEAARALQHAFNNPLTALLAEAQLLELEPLADEAHAAVGRILALARRLVVLSRKLGMNDPGALPR
jgi:signal transduction histidine kinase